VNGVDFIIGAAKYLAVVAVAFVVFAIAYVVFIYPAESQCAASGGEPVIDKTWTVRCVEPGGQP